MPGHIHSIETAAASVHEIVPSRKLPHNEDRQVLGDADYLGI
jgi:IS5 family transposase